MGGLLSGATPSAELTELLGEDASDFTWAAAATGANQAAGYQLAVEEPVMAIGGFNGTAPSPTLAEFKQLVAEGQIHWYIGSGSDGQGGGPGGGGGGHPPRRRSPHGLRRISRQRPSIPFRSTI
mgnify:CR=1 FL=1